METKNPSKTKKQQRGRRRKMNAMATNKGNEMWIKTARRKEMKRILNV